MKKKIFTIMIKKHKYAIMVIHMALFFILKISKKALIGDRKRTGFTVIVL